MFTIKYLPLLSAMLVVVVESYQWRRQNFMPVRANLRHVILLKGQYIIPIIRGG